jgi:hypothetical protein
MRQADLTRSVSYQKRTFHRSSDTERRRLNPLNRVEALVVKKGLRLRLTFTQRPVVLKYSLK